MKLFPKILFFLILLWSCSQKTTDEVPSEQDSVAVSNQNEKMDWNKAEKIENSEVADSTRKRIYRTELNEKTVFYVQKNGKWGLEYEDSTELLAVEYDKIYSPDATAVGFIEIQLDGKLGLFDYKKKEIVGNGYEVIFPVEKATNYEVAIGRIGDKYFSITKPIAMGFDIEITDSESYSFYNKLAGETIFDITKDVKQIYQIGKNEVQQVSFGTVIVPSYIEQMKVLPNTLDNLDLTRTLLATVESKMKVEKTISLTDKISLLFTSFYEEGIGIRDGYSSQKESVVTINSSNQVVDSETLLEDVSSGSLKSMLNGKNEIKITKKGLLEVRNVDFSNNQYSNYEFMSQYVYYQISNVGRIEKLSQKRFYDFTKYVRIDSSYFAGSFFKYAHDQDDEGNMWVSSHLTIEDLDIMRNEIFAEYGYKFKSEKWQNYFKKKQWYFPQHDNVDKFLSDIEKENIQTILKMKKQMEKEGEQKFTKRSREMIVVAG